MIYVRASDAKIERLYQPELRYFDHFARHAVHEFLTEAQDVFARVGRLDAQLVRPGVALLNVSVRAGMKDGEVRAGLRRWESWMPHVVPL